jgi:hypothetical protein
MNSTLIDAFLDLGPVAFKQSYEQIRMENPKSVFCKMFAWFVAKYGHTSADNRKANCTAMDLEWHPLQGFELLVARLFRGATFANLAKHPIPDNDIVDIGIHIIHWTGFFAEEYKAWITRSNNTANDMDCAAFHPFWENAVNIASFTATIASQLGYGMNAVEDDQSVAYLTNAVSNFGVAYAATQESLRNNNASINAMQGQIQMLCNTLDNQPPAGMPQYPQQTNQGCQAQGRQRGQQQNQGQQGQPSGGGGGTNNGGGQNGLYRGNNTSHGTNPGSTFNSGSGSYPTQGTSNTLCPFKKFNNWNYCHTHGCNIQNNHTSTTCVQPGVNHQHVATRSNMIGGNNKGIFKTILVGANAQYTPAAQPAQQPTNYTPTFAMPFGNNGPRFPTAPGSWGCGPHADAYQHANNIPSPQP